MGSMMNNYFYGKAGQADYTVEQMPTTRIQLFFTTLRVRFSSMVGLNFVYLLFVIPVAIWLFIGVQALMNLATDGYFVGPEMEAAYVEYDALRTEYDAIINEAENTALLEYDLEDVEARIGRLSAGEVLTVEVPAVVEGGESTIREVTMDELLKEKQTIEDKLAMQEIYRAHADDKAYMDDLIAKYADAANLYGEYQRSAIMSNLSMTLLILIPFMGLAGVGTTGLMYVLRNWARDEHSFMWQDFKGAIKENWKQGLIIGLLNGASLFLCYVAYFTYDNMAKTQSQFFAIPQMLMLVLLAVWWMMNEVIFPMMVTYDMTIRQLLRNSAIMVIARLPISVAILLGSLLIPVVVMLYVPFIYAILAMVVFYGVIGCALTGFVQASFANSCFDKYLNPRIEGAEVNKGLRVEEDDEDDEVGPTLAEMKVEQKEDRFWEHKSE